MFPSVRLLLGAFLLISASPLFAQIKAPVGGGIWSDVNERTLVRTLSVGVAPVQRDIVPQAYRTLQMNKVSLANLLSSVVPESTGPIEVNGTEFQVPLPSGEYGRFLIQESPLMEPKLAGQFPQIKTYVGKGIDDPTATMRMDVTPRGFHAIILSATGQVFIDPYARSTDTNYISYYKRDFVASKPFSCTVETHTREKVATAAGTSVAKPTGASLRSYRLALACTGEYATAVCSPNAPTLAGTLAAIITSINRCSAIYERELAIRFVLINNDDKIIYLNGNTDPYTNGNGSTMLNQNQSNIDSVIGAANYDFGHVFSTGGGGVAQLGVVCETGFKAQGVTGSPNPVGDPYDVDYVVHEMGHEFGANHPFNGTSGSCSGANRNAATAYEPGSGITIMAYAGICSPQDLAAHSDDYFHTISYDEIDAYTSAGGGGVGCAQSTPTGNNAPAIGALANRTIPMQTPFSLTASASDPDGDTLTYCWEEFDKGNAQDPTAAPRDNGASPIFRTFPPTTNPTRIFPSLTYILNNANVPPATVNTFATGEFLPTTTRTMTYRITVRDNRIAGGGSNYASMTVASTTTAGPFVITAPNVAATFAAGAPMTVTWNVANTTAALVSCANVKISLSTDGGYTFPIELANSVPNNGSALVTLPNIANVATTQGRVKVEAVGNIFFDISDANLTITSSNTAPAVTINNSITVVRGTPTATVATVGTATDANGNPLTLSVSDVPFGVSITPSLVGSNISFSAVVGCSVVTTLSSRTYPVTLTVADSVGSSTTRTVNLIVTPNPSPTLGGYPDVNVSPNNSVNSTPATPAADANNNLSATPYSVLPTTLPGGGTVSVNQANGVVTVATTNATSLGTTNIRVTALDSCGAAAVSLFKVNVASTNPILQAGTASAPTAEGCAPANGAADPGETVTINLPINNIGGGATSSLVATLQNSGGVTPITSSQNYGVIAANGSATRPFQLSTTGSCGGTVTATLQLQDGATNFGNITYLIRLGVLTTTTTLLQNFDSVSPPALPAGWVAQVASGSMTPWATNTTTPDTVPNSISASTVTTASDNRLTSPSVPVPASAPQLSFRHRWTLETGYDGGILEISINGGAFVDIITAGGSFVSGGYTGTISTTDGSPIAGASAWTGTTFNTAYTTTLINLPASAAGQNAQFRWRLACDTGVAAGTWRLDTINVISGGYVCSSCSSPPAITNGPPPSPVIVGTPYSFAFTATGNPAPTFSLTNGVLPPGLTLSAGGIISGTPSSAGNGSFPNITVTASNGNPPNAQQTFALAAATRVANYLAGYGLSGDNAALLFDFDGDGILNLMEYGLSLNPTVTNVAGLPAVTIKNYGGVNYLSMTFTRSSVATDLTYIVQGSSDLVNWTNLATSAGGAAPGGTGFVTETGPAPLFTVEVRDTVAIDGTPDLKRFLRLQITTP